MSAVSESIAQRMTLGMLAERYGFDIDPEFASNVTITSLSDAVDTISPGAMYICDSNHLADLPRAEQSGAYAALLPRTVPWPGYPVWHPAGVRRLRQPYAR